MIFVDTSVLIKAFVTEQGSHTVLTVIARMRGKLYLTPAVVLEVLGALAKARRSNVLRQQAYRKARSEFLASIGKTFVLFALHETEFMTAYSLVDRYRQLSAGSWDVLHIASALRLRTSSPRRPVTLASSDGGMLGLARAAGIPTFDPEVEPFSALVTLER